jgi:hypothetical protein
MLNFFRPPFSKSPINVFLFTLSGFPFHINLKHLLSISFLYNVFGKIWLIFKMNIDVKKHKQFLNNIPEFYKNVLTSWIKTGGGQLSSPLTFSNVRKQILWGNRFITFEKKYLSK